MKVEDRIKELERKVKDLEARPIALPPVYVPYPVPQPFPVYPYPWPYWQQPPVPYYPYLVTYCGGGNTGMGIGGNQITLQNLS